MAGITYVPTWEGWPFLAVVGDVFTKHIVGWSMRDDLSARIVDALGMAAGDPTPSSGLGIASAPLPGGVCDSRLS